MLNMSMNIDTALQKAAVKVKKKKFLAGKTALSAKPVT